MTIDEPKKDNAPKSEPKKESNTIGFEPSKLKGDLPPVEDVVIKEMERKADKNVQFARILAEKKLEDEQQHGELETYDNTFPPELVVQISETISYGIQCNAFIYNNNEAYITGKCISLWFPMFSRKWYYTITAGLILTNKIIKCGNAIGSFLGLKKPGTVTEDDNKTG